MSNMVGQKENRPCVPYFFVYSGADFDGDGLTSHNFRYSMLKAKDFLDGETAWEAFPDHILSHIPPRKAWKQRRQERRRASFSERKGAKIARKGRKNIPTAIWEHQAASSSLATPTIAAAVFDLPRHFFCLPLPTLSLHTQKPSGRNARHPLGFLCFLLLFLLAFPFCAFWGFFVYFFRRVYNSAEKKKKARGTGEFPRFSDGNPDGLRGVPAKIPAAFREEAGQKIGGEPGRNRAETREPPGRPIERQTGRKPDEKPGGKPMKNGRKSDEKPGEGLTAIPTEKMTGISAAHPRRAGRKTAPFLFQVQKTTETENFNRVFF